jgi:hypothetical protein
VDRGTNPTGDATCFPRTLSVLFPGAQELRDVTIRASHIRIDTLFGR